MNPVSLNRAAGGNVPPHAHAQGGKGKP